MNRLLAAFLAISILACNDSEEDSPYREIVSKPPYNEISDSIRKDPKNDELYFRRAVMLNRNNLPEPALADFRKAWMLNPIEKYAFGVSNSLLESKPDSALVFLDEALERFPESFLLQLSKARALSDLNRIDDAIMECESIIAKQQGLGEVHLLLAQLYRDKGDIRKAAEALEVSYRISPDLVKAFDLAFVMAENRDRRTIAFCDSLIATDSQQLHVKPLFVKGIYYSNVNEKEKALQIFDQVITQDHNFLDAYFEKCRILIDQKKFSTALQNAELAITIRPSSADAWYWMATCQQSLGQIEEAKLNYQKAYNLDKSFTEAKEAADKLAK